ncbi:unnamed protein product [Nippostrongylus brasiliensis]|uniref:Ras-associating domain-containing protein n=1 Tax=Nippostrongylus brasiliensis TaxID=27835 RepID=A0A0N4Y9P7_NIPBR|nr:unnamed protein product [Nippostrongylus brasiliensis]
MQQLSLRCLREHCVQGSISGKIKGVIEKIFYLFIIIIKDGQALKCAYKDQTFCGPVKRAHELNSLSKFFLEGDKFKEDRERLSLANGKVLIVLKKENKSELIPALRNVFDSETNAIFQVKVSCSGSANGTYPCQLGITAICLATEQLVNATMVVADEDQKYEILEAYKKYQQKEDRLQWADQAYELGKKVMDILQTWTGFQ